jgi:hypothetical protein
MAMTESRMSLEHFLVLYSLLFATFFSVDATQVMRRPDDYNSSTVNSFQKRDNNKVSFAYFTNWGIYKANFRMLILFPLLGALSNVHNFLEPTDIVTDSLTRKSSLYQGSV